MSLTLNMKNKKAEQAADRKRHQLTIKAGRRKEPILKRENPVRTEKPTILIVCEGKNTEPSYFGQFRLSSATIYPIGEGYNTISLVKRAVFLSQEKHYDQVWCVFDKDDFPASDFNNAIAMAEAKSFGIAWSNQAFEYWLLLHFIDHQGGAMPRNKYNTKINKYLQPFGISYDGNGSKTVTVEMFELLTSIEEQSSRNRTQLAIDRAKRNHHQSTFSNPAKQESCSSVYKLVEELLKYI